MTLRKQYNQYVKEWMKENPPFAGPYDSECLSFDGWVNNYMVKFAEWVISRSYGEDLKLKDDTLEKYKKEKGL